MKFESGGVEVIMVKTPRSKPIPNKEKLSKMSVSRILSRLVRFGWDWRIKLKDVSEETRQKVAMIELDAKIIRMFLKGMPVFFMNVAYWRGESKALYGAIELHQNCLEYDTYPGIEEENDTRLILDLYLYWDFVEDAEEEDQEEYEPEECRWEP